MFGILFEVARLETGKADRLVANDDRLDVSSVFIGETVKVIKYLWSSGYTKGVAHIGCVLL